MPKSQNMKKAFEVLQKKDESPSEFLERLQENVRKYSGLDMRDKTTKAMLKLHFVSNACSDINKKIQKIERWNNKTVGELLEEATKVFVRRRINRHRMLGCWFRQCRQSQSH